MWNCGLTKKKHRKSSLKNMLTATTRHFWIHRDTSSGNLHKYILVILARQTMRTWSLLYMFVWSSTLLILPADYVPYNLFFVSLWPPTPYMHLKKQWVVAFSSTAKDTKTCQIWTIYLGDNKKKIVQLILIYEFSLPLSLQIIVRKHPALLKSLLQQLTHPNWI